VIGLREDAINRINQLDEMSALAVARMREVHHEIGVNVSGIAAQNDDAVAEDDSFFDVVGDDEDRPRGNLMVEPKFQEFAAQRFRREDVERGERFIHEEHFGLDHQSAGDTHALLHAAGKLFGVCRFESVKADGVYNAQGALVALDGRHAARFKRRFDVLDNRQPRKERETLKHDGHIRSFAAHRLPVPVDGAGAGRRKTGQHAEQRRLSAAGGPQQRDDLPRIDGEIRCGDDLNAAAAGLWIEFLKLARLDDRSGCAVCSAHERMYYRSTAA